MGMPELKTRKSIRFVLDGEIVEIENVDPTRTVLQYLREDLGRTGTKEGCAEGDCGACTVVLAEPDVDGKGLRAKAVNACIQFLPTLDGKELLTVESLSGHGDKSHPVQEAMVLCHGSQCGFCTPGFVMSMFALWKTEAAPQRTDIDNALAGNLCRCTGYRPIIDAAQAMYEIEVDDKVVSWNLQPAADTLAADEQQRAASLDSIRSATTLELKGAGKQYFAPSSSEDLAAIVCTHPDALLLAGGTDVGLWVTKQHKELHKIIYTGNVAELARIRKTDTHLEIGAAATLTAAMRDIIVLYPALEELFLRFASPPIRNAGTLGGNIANGSPIGDSMPALLALDTTIVLRTGSKRREIGLDDFYIDYQETALQAGEFLETIRVPLPVDGEHLASYKISKRFDQDISAVCGAYRLVLDGDRVKEIRIACGGMAAIPKRAAACEEALMGQPWTESVLVRAADALAEDFTPIGDMRASAAYRLQVAVNLLRRFYLESTGMQTSQVYNYGR